MTGGQRTLIRLCFASVCALALLIPATAAAGPAEEPIRVTMPGPRGHFEVGTRAIELTDRARRDTPGLPGPRRLMVQVTYPRAEGKPCKPADYISPQVMPLLAEAVSIDRPGEILTGICRGGKVAGGERPILVFSHAFTADRFVYGALINDLASRGYIVLAPDHLPDAFAVEYPGGELVLGQYGRPLMADTTVTAEKIAELNQLRAVDSRFVLDRAKRMGAARKGFLSGHVDLSRVGILGHSLGGSTAARVAQVDRRIDAVADLDGALYGPWTERTGDDTPFLLLAAEGGVATIFTDQAICDYMAGLTGPRFAFELDGALHFSFSDFQALAPRIAEAYPEWIFASAYENVTGTIPPKLSLNVQRRALTQFFNRYVKGQKVPRPRAFGPYSPIPLGDCA